MHQHHYQHYCFPYFYPSAEFISKTLCFLWLTTPLVNQDHIIYAQHYELCTYLSGNTLVCCGKHSFTCITINLIQHLTEVVHKPSRNYWLSSLYRNIFVNGEAQASSSVTLFLKKVIPCLISVQTQFELSCAAKPDASIFY